MWRRRIYPAQDNVGVPKPLAQDNVGVPKPTAATAMESTCCQSSSLGEARAKTSGRAGRTMKAVADALRRPRRSAEPLLDGDSIAVIAARLGLHVARASLPGVCAPGAEAVLVLFGATDFGLAEDLSARAADRPIFALLLDTSAVAAGEVAQVLAFQRRLLACGFDDVLLNFADPAALEVALSMSLLRCTARRRADSEAGSLCLSEDSWCESLPGAPAVERGASAELTAHDARPRLAPASICDPVAAETECGPDADRSTSERRALGSAGDPQRASSTLARRPPLDGIWLAVEVSPRSGAIGRWVRKLVINGPNVMLGDGSRVTIDVVGGRRRLCGGELELVGRSLVRHGRTTIITFRRLGPPPPLAFGHGDAREHGFGTR